MLKRNILNLEYHKLVKDDEFFGKLPPERIRANAYLAIFICEILEQDLDDCLNNGFFVQLKNSVEYGYIDSISRTTFLSFLEEYLGKVACEIFSRNHGFYNGIKMSTAQISKEMKYDLPATENLLDAMKPQMAPTVLRSYLSMVFT